MHGEKSQKPKVWGSGDNLSKKENLLVFAPATTKSG